MSLAVQWLLVAATARVAHNTAKDPSGFWAVVAGLFAFGGCLMGLLETVAAIAHDLAKSHG